MYRSLHLEPLLALGSLGDCSGARFLKSLGGLTIYRRSARPTLEIIRRPFACLYVRFFEAMLETIFLGLDTGFFRTRHCSSLDF